MIFSTVRNFRGLKGPNPDYLVLALDSEIVFMFLSLTLRRSLLGRVGHGVGDSSRTIRLFINSSPLTKSLFHVVMEVISLVNSLGVCVYKRILFSPS